jgi:hypothetical protein
VEPKVLDLAEIPAMLTAIDTSSADGSISPLTVAQQVVGFPIPVPVPAGSTLYRMEVTTFVGTEITEWRWLYEAFAPGDVGDIDITAEGQGPGSIALADQYDPILADLGFGRNGSTGSDPGEPGGPNSINHVYPPLNGVVIDGYEAEIANVKVWASEDLLFPDDTLEPGYRVDLDAGLASEASPVPLLAALRASIDVPEGSIMGASSMMLWSRSEDSFDADLGLQYLEISLRWSLPLSVGEAVTYFNDATRLGPAWLAAKPSFFNDGEYELTSIAPSFGGGEALDVLLTDRYPGTLRIAEAGDSSSVLELELRLESGREVLVAPAV